MSDSPYLPHELGFATIDPPGSFVAGTYTSLTLAYAAGKFGIDDSGHLKVVWRGTSDMGKPQFSDPTAPNYTTVEASNGAVLECRVERITTRPWNNTLWIRVGRGFLREGETITIRLGDQRHGSPGVRLQTNVEPTFEFKFLIDAFAVYQFAELPTSPEIELIPGPAVRWKALLPTLGVVADPFRLCLVAEDMWGNPTVFPERFGLQPSAPVEELPTEISAARTQIGYVIEGLSITRPGTIDIAVLDPEGQVLCRSNPMRVLESTELRHFWGDLHGQSEETIGTNSVDDYFVYARDRAFLDIVGHQGNDFQITDGFWQRLNEVTSACDVPGRFVTLPGYEWSGNTGLGGDRNVFYRTEGRPIRRSSRVLVQQADGEDCFTAGDLFKALGAAHEDAVVIAHVGGRYADLSVAHDGRFERAVEVHSTWGTFEWILHDAFDLGHRVGVVCHSDDHKGRPGATRPGASTFGAIGGLTCYMMPELSRDALFDALRKRHHYGTTGTRLFLSVTGTFAAAVAVFDEDPALGSTRFHETTAVMMGDIVSCGGAAMRLSVDVTGSASIERVDVFHGKELVRTVRPFAREDLGCRVRVLWSGAEYRGRGREVMWSGKASLVGNRFERTAAVNFLNPERPLTEVEPGTSLQWRSVTTGNIAGFDVWLEHPDRGRLRVETNIASLDCDLSVLGEDEMSIDAAGLGRSIRVLRLPDTDGSRTLSFTHEVTHTTAGDLPIYVRVTQLDGHQAWSSPIYLIP